MRIDQDFSMYYHDTYVGLPLNDGIYPFYVDSVEFSEEEMLAFEDSHEDIEDYFEYLYKETENIYDALVFHGHYFNKDGDSYGASIPMRDLIFENPQLGYVYHRDQWKWYTYNPSQSVKKGLCVKRLNIQGRLTGDLLHKLFNVKVYGDLLDRDLLLQEDGLHYKGVHIASREQDNIFLDNRFSIMEDYINSLLPQGITLVISN